MKTAEHVQWFSKINLSEDAARVIVRAEKSSLSRQFGTVSTGDLVLGLLEDATLTHLFESYNISSNTLRAKLTDISKIGAYKGDTIFEFNPLAKKALDQAKSEFAEGSDKIVTPKSILQAIIYAENGHGLKLLRKNNIDIDKLKQNLSGDMKSTERETNYT